MHNWGRFAVTADNSSDCWLTACGVVAPKDSDNNYMQCQLMYFVWNREEMLRECIYILLHFISHAFLIDFPLCSGSVGLDDFWRWERVVALAEKLLVEREKEVIHIGCQQGMCNVLRSYQWFFFCSPIRLVFCCQCLKCRGFITKHLASFKRWSLILTLQPNPLVIFFFS